MRTVTAGCIALLVTVALSACSGSTSNPRASFETSTSAAADSAPTEALRAAALAWVHAFLTGTVPDIYDLQGPDCRTEVKSTPSKIAAATKELQRLRDGIARRTNFDGAEIESRISGVAVRNVSASRGEAEVRYQLPVVATGNDNWVTYELVEGKWKVQDCRAPFGGSSESSSSHSTTP